MDDIQTLLNNYISEKRSEITNLELITKSLQKQKVVNTNPVKTFTTKEYTIDQFEQNDNENIYHQLNSDKI